MVRLPPSFNSWIDSKAPIREALRIWQSSAKFCILDPMPTSLLKENIAVLALIFTDVVNRSLESGVVPAAMKHAIITLILKKRGLYVNCLPNYRPISNFLSKTLERYVASELRHYLTQVVSTTHSKHVPAKHSTDTDSNKKKH